MGHDVQEGSGARGRTPRARLGPDAVEAIAATLQALAAPSRLLILGRLREGPATVTALAAGTGMEQSAVSHQLRLLRDLGLVDGERHGRSVTYTLYDDHVAALLDEAVFHAEHLRLGLRDRSPATAGRSGEAAGRPPVPHGGASWSGA
jgi:DNA-binding transcriptional ArsR family regulator